MIGSPEIRALTGRAFATIPRLWSARAERTPDAPFLLWEGRAWTYRDAWREIEERARAFAALGARPGTRVCGLLANSPDCLWSWFGALRAGASYVALNPALKGVLLEDRLRASRAALLVTDTASSPSLADLDLGMFSAVLCASPDGLQVTAAGKQSVAAPLLPLEQLPDDPF